MPVTDCRPSTCALWLDKALRLSVLKALRLSVLVLALVAPSLSPTRAQSAITVSNSGFETPSLGSGSGSYQGNPQGSSWAWAGAGISGNGSAFTGANPNAPEGSQVAFLQGNDSFSQSLPGFQAGARYTLTFSAAQRNYNGQPGEVSHQTVQVLLDNQAVGAPISPADINYHDYSVSFTATAGTHTLAFQGAPADGKDNTAFLDNVRLTTVPFSLTAAPQAVTIARGTVGAVGVTLTPGGGFSGAVQLAPTGLPSGISALFYPSSTVTLSTVVLPEYSAPTGEGIGGSVSTNLVIAVPMSAQPGTYQLQITGTAPGATNSGTVTLTIN